MTFPSETARSAIYSTLIGGNLCLAPEDRFCPTCREQWHECDCNALPSYQGADLTPYRKDVHNGR